MTARRTTGEGGFALLAVLLAGGFLALLLAAMTRTAHSDGAVSRNLAVAAQAKAAVDGAVRLAIFDLLTDDAASLPRDGSTRKLEIGGVAVTVAVQDAAGLVDVNSANPELLSAFFLAESRSPAIAASLVTAILSRRPTLAAGVARLRPFRSVAELAALPGMPDELYHRLLGLMTVSSRQYGIDPRTAPPEILYALPGLDPQRVAESIALRASSPDAPRRLLAPAARFFAASPRDAVAISAVASLSGITAERRAIVRLARGAVPPYRILEWQAGTT